MKKSFLDEMRNVPTYQQAEAARYLDIPRGTLRYWAFGKEKVRPIIQVPKSDENLLSFFNLVELHVLSSIKDYGPRLQEIRKTLRFVKKELGGDRPLLSQDFLTDGVNLFVERYGQLIQANSEKQMLLLDVLKSSLRRIKRDKSKIPIKIYPFTQHQEGVRTRIKNAPKLISISPGLNSGRPVIDGTGISTSMVNECFEAGDSFELLAEDYELSYEQVQEAIRYERAQAA